MIFIDIETHQLYSDICMIQWSYGKEVHYKEYPSKKFVKKLLKGKTIIGHNLSYDLSTIQYEYDITLGDIELHDTFYAARIAYPEAVSYGLKDLVDTGTEKLGSSFTTAEAKKRRAATPEQIEYGINDIKATMELFNRPEIQEAMKTKAYKVDVKSLRYSLEYQRNGLPVDQEALRAELVKVRETIAHNVKLLDGLNVQSPKQVTEALGVRKSDKDTLVALIASGNELAQLVYDQRRLLKARKMLESWDFERLHTFFNPAGAGTSRFTSSGLKPTRDGYVNMQQISRQYQYMFKDTREGYVTFQVDFSTAELLAAASLMNEPVMYNEIKDGLDLHIQVAKDIMGIAEPTKEDRSRAKAISFGKIFGMGVETFIDYAKVGYGVTFTRRESVNIHRAYHRKYKAISKFHKMIWNTYERKPTYSALGHCTVGTRSGTQMINYATQATISEATKVSIIRLCEKYPKAVKLISNTVHDSIYMSVKEKDFKKWSKRLQKAMTYGWEYVCRSDRMHFKDMKIGVEVER